MTAAPMVTSGRLRPISLGGARLARPMAWALVGLLGLVTLVAVFARQLAPHNPIQPVGPLNVPPLSPGLLLGTDGIGRDLLSRTLIGIQVSWLSALVVVASGLLIGGTVGLIAGATGGWVDSILMRDHRPVPRAARRTGRHRDRRRPGLGAAQHPGRGGARLVAVLRPHRARRGQGAGRPPARRGRPAGRGQPDRGS